jgi:hypothetical protein
MLIKLRILAILLLIFPTVAAAAQDAEHPAHAAKQSRPHKSAAAK